MLEVVYFWNGWVKKDGFNVNLVLCNWPNLDSPINVTSNFNVSSKQSTLFLVTLVLCSMTTDRKPASPNVGCQLVRG